METYTIPKWIQKYEEDEKPFSIDYIILEKYCGDWTLFFYGNNDTTGGIILNKASGKEVCEILDYAEYRKIPLICKGNFQRKCNSVLRLTKSESQNWCV